MQWIWIPIAVILGCLAAWLINYLADVLPIATDDEPPAAIRRGRPVCRNEACHMPFKWIDYILLRKCRTCGRRRSIRTIAVIAFSVAATLYIWFSPPKQLGFVLGIILLAYLLLVTIIDLEHHLILGPLSITGLVLGIVTGILMHGWKFTLLGGMAGFAIMYFFYLLGKAFTRLRTKRRGIKDNEEALSSGDVTLATILGVILGWPLIWFGLLLGVLLSGVVSLLIILSLKINRKYAEQALMVFIPLGPYYILSAILLIYLPNWITAVVH